MFMSLTWRPNSSPKILSRSRSRYREICSNGNASPQLLRGPLRGRVSGYVKVHYPTPLMRQHQKYVQHLEADRGHAEEIDRDQFLAWLFRKVRQVCEGGLRCRTMYLATLVSQMVMPNLSSSPWMWGAPHRGLSRLICRIKSRTSRGTAGRPGLPRRTFQVQNRRKPWRCHAMTVSGRTMASAARQFCQTRDRTTHK